MTKSAQKVLKVVKVELLDEKHYKTQHGYAVPVMYHLEDGSTYKTAAKGTRLKDAKTWAARLVADPGNRAIEYHDGYIMETSHYTLGASGLVAMED